MYQNQATKKANKISSVQNALKSVPLNVHSARTLASYVLRNLGYLDLTPTYLAKPLIFSEVEIMNSHLTFT